MAGCYKQTGSGVLANLLGTPGSREELRRMGQSADAACERFGLAAVRDRPAGKLPAGQQRLVELARAAVGRPRLLCLDEPSSGLNSEEVGRLMETLRRLNAEGIDDPSGVARHGPGHRGAGDPRAVLRRDHRQRPAGRDPRRRARARGLSGGMSGTCCGSRTSKRATAACRCCAACTLAIERNESVAIIGANGAGKSTLVRAICGLLPVSARAHHARRARDPAIAAASAHTARHRGGAGEPPPVRRVDGAQQPRARSRPRRAARGGGPQVQLGRGAGAISVHARTARCTGGAAERRRAADGGHGAGAAAAPRAA